MSADRPISREEVAVLLAPALGHEKSLELVISTARALGVTRAELTPEQVRAVFDKLVTVDGLVGVVARFAVSRGDLGKLLARPAPAISQPQIGRPQFRVGASAPPRPSAPTATVDIMHLISPALGVEKARDAIEQAAARRGVDIATGLSHDGALAVLDEMSKVEGIVGVVARFAKARFLLTPK
jgi:hypothetical protein